MRKKTIDKYEKVIREILQHDTILGKDVRDIIVKHNASNAISIALQELGYISKSLRGVPHKVLIKDIDNDQLKKIVETSNKRHKKHTYQDQGEGHPIISPADKVTLKVNTVGAGDKTTSEIIDMLYGRQISTDHAKAIKDILVRNGYNVSIKVTTIREL